MARLLCFERRRRWREFPDIAAGSLTKTIKTGEEPEGVSVTADGKLVYSTNEADGTVSVIDTATGKLLKQIKVGRRPRNVVFMPEENAYVNAENDGAIGYLDTVKNVLIEPISIGTPGQIKPMGMALSRTRQLYVSTGKGKMVFVIDTATNQPGTSFEWDSGRGVLRFPPTVRLCTRPTGLPTTCR